MDKRQLAGKLGVSVSTVERLRLPYTRVGGQNRYLMSEVEAALGRTPSGQPVLEPWLDKAMLGAYLSCSERWLELRMGEGMPRAMIAGRVKFKVSQVEPWLQDHGHMERKGDWPRTT